MTRAKTSRATKAAAKKPAGKQPGAGGAVPLSKKEARDALDREASLIKRLRKDVDKNAWQIGRRLSQIAELGLHKAASFDKLEDYAQHAFGFARAATFQYMRVAAAFSEELSASFGIEKLDRALSYIAKTPEPETAKDIPKLKIRVPDDAGHVTEKRFADVSVPELRAAAQNEAKKQGKVKKTRASAALDAHASQLAVANRSIDRVVGRSNAARAEVSARTADGLVLVDVRGIPVSDLGKALLAVAKAFAAKPRR